MSFDEKSNWLSKNPETFPVQAEPQEFLKSTAKPLGEIVDHDIRIEFQARGSPHAHG